MIPILQRSFLILLIAIAFLLPVFQRIIPMLIILLVANWLLLLPSIKNRLDKITVPFYLLIGFFLWHILGISYSANFDKAVADVLSKLSFLIFPLIFTFSKGLSEQQVKWTLLAFIGGCLSASLIDLGIFYYNVHIGKYSLNYLFGDYFSVLMHLGYFAIYLNFAIVSAAYIWLKYKHQEQYILWLMPLMMLFFAVIIVITTSKNGILMLLLMSIIFSTYYIFKSRRYITGLISLLAVLTLLITLIEVFPSVYIRFKSSYNAFSKEEIDKGSTESTMLRRMAWKSSGKLISENFWFGVGTGDVKYKLTEAYKKAGFEQAFKRGINSHNQYLQTFIALGLFGVLLLVMLLLFTFYLSVIQRNYLLSLFLFINIFAALTESIYEVQAGIVFFSFFLGILFFGTKNKLTVDTAKG